MAQVFECSGGIRKYRINTNPGEMLKTGPIQDYSVRPYQPLGIDANLTLRVSIQDASSNPNLNREPVRAYCGIDAAHAEFTVHMWRPTCITLPGRTCS